MKRTHWIAAVALFALATVTLLHSRSTAGQRTTPEKQARIQWVEKCLKDLQSIKPGMTRGQMLKILGEEGGLYSPGWGHYVHKECPYFKVDIEFAFTRDKDGRGQWKPDDKITKVTRPYIDWSVMD
jgi:hypothetical protein